MAIKFIRRFSVFVTILLIATSIARAADTPDASSFHAAIAALEHDSGGRIGVAAVNTATDQRIGYRADERFAMCSTFKILLVSAVLARVDAGKMSLDQKIPFNSSDLLDYAPVTRAHVDDGSMSIAALSAAALDYSDNTAANLLLKQIGGPQAVTGFVRGLGDTVTRLDRNEPGLNSNIKGDERDTTTPNAMVQTMWKLLTPKVLSAGSQQHLVGWMINNTTGDDRLRAAFRSWTVGDKTGTGENGASSDVAYAWPPGKSPYVIAVYYSGSKVSRSQQDAVISQVGQLVAEALAGPQQPGHTP